MCLFCQHSKHFLPTTRAHVIVVDNTWALRRDLWCGEVYLEANKRV